MNLVSARTSKKTLERDVPVKRLESGSDLRKSYQYRKKLGEGSYGVVFEATHIETQTKWAIKSVCKPEPGSSAVAMLDNEINILKEVDHAHIIHLQEIYRTPKKVYLVTELCEGGDLKQLLQRKKYFTEDETRNIIYSLADAVVYLHRRDIIHRDLKLGNILVKDALDEDDGRINIKVADFGLSVKTGGIGIENTMTGACGTLPYMAPEMMFRHAYTEWCDVWSIGIIMYMLLCGQPPFISKEKADLHKEIENKEVTFTQPIWASVSDAAQNLLTCLLKVDPAERMSANQLLKNPWTTGDTNAPAILPNVWELMRLHQEEEKRTETLKVSSLTSSVDTLEPFPVPQAVSTQKNCRTHAKLGPETARSSCTPCTSTKLYHGETKESGGSIQQDKHINSTDTLTQPNVSEPSTSLPSQLNFNPHAGVKPSIQPSAKQRRPRDTKDFSSRQKSTSNLSKAADGRPSASNKVGRGPRKPPASSKTNTHAE